MRILTVISTLLGLLGWGCSSAPKFDRSVLDPSILRDRGAVRWFALWGKSLNFDEITQKEIVPAAEIDALLAQLEGPKRSGRVVHAGIEHTYGYLLSTLETPFGYKRDRWTQGDLEAGLGLSPGVLGPTPTKGSFLKNVTFAMARIALADAPKVQAFLNEHANEVHPALATFPFDLLQVERRVEKLGTTELRTDFVSFPNPTVTQKNTHWLIYSIRTADEPHAKLITAFPVNTEFVQKPVTAPARLRYNAYL